MKRHDVLEFAATMQRILPNLAPYAVAQMCDRLMGAARTHQRLAEAACNGDWPADNGQRDAIDCTRCEIRWARAAMRKDHTAPRIPDPSTGQFVWIPLICPVCRIRERMENAISGTALGLRFSGDPRGCTVKVVSPSGETNDWAHEGYCVPM